ncbi:MAG: hypothetical protein GX575_01480 [Candidatus Anammoximicrobium sp.]|nr:hypothetical protein [Candidatus Anammoximicrobium sp.]
MLVHLRVLWSDERAFVVSSELVLIATIMVIGMVVGLVTVRDQVVQELADMAAAVSRTEQAFSFSGVTGHSSSIAGSAFDDVVDFCDNFNLAGTTVDQPGQPACHVNVSIPATVGESSGG